jgi:4a-hydroxytetrahydrobiopterin dehydratase
MPEELTHQKCVPCEGGVDPMTEAEIAEYLPAVAGWERDGKAIAKEFRFKDFAEALAFVNRVGELAEAEGHHPDIHLHDWNRVRLVLFTHAIGGLHLNDFVLAAKINTLSYLV